MGNAMPRDMAADAAAYRAAGRWLDKTVDQLLHEATAHHPDKTAIVADRADREDVRRFTYRELGEMTERIARSLTRLGVGTGDVVTLQLPNWWEFVGTILACGRIGAIVNPVMPILRERELLYILNFCQSKAFILPKTYRGFDYEAMAKGLRPELLHLQHLIVVDGDGPDSFSAQLLAEDAPRGAPQHDWPGLDPDELAVLMFTSGTTGEPKGVMHTSNSLVACTKALAERFGMVEDDILLVSSPVAHMTGYAALVLQAIYLGSTMVLQDVWAPKHGIELMTREGVTYTAASTPFLTDIVDTVKAGIPRPPKLRSFLCAGAPIPPVLIERAVAELGLTVCSLWGMTESLASTLTEPSRAAVKSSTTDGRPVEGVEVRVVDTEGRDAPLMQSGRLLVRGAQMFVGYYKKPDLPTFDDEGWFDTGDVAYMDDEGYIRISGRIKDVLIRGGENVPVVEIENLMYKHPSIAAVAIVGYPDTRLGERGCAFVELRDGQALDLAAVQTYLEGCRMAKHFWPERVEVLATLPRTASGKIQKFRLKEIAQSYGDQPAAAPAR